MDTRHINITPAWKESKETLWERHFQSLTEDSKPCHKLIRPHHYWIAASIFMAVLGLSSVIFSHSKDIDIPKGQHGLVSLPDGSKVHLNADSRLKYKPWLWRMNRKVSLEGEAFFEVAPGQSFTVHCKQGEVTVLGTSFNVLARNQHFQVDCLRGCIQVHAGQSTLLMKSAMQCLLQSDTLTLSNHKSSPIMPAWTQGMFHFTDAPLTEVILEIERQYNIQILSPDCSELYYSGYFSRDKEPKEVLTILEKTFDITLSMN